MSDYSDLMKRLNGLYSCGPDGIKEDRDFGTYTPQINKEAVQAIQELQAQVEQLKIQNESFREQLVCEFMQYQEIFNYTNQGEIAKIAINHKEVIGELLEEEPNQLLNKVKAKAVREARECVVLSHPDWTDDFEAGFDQAVGQYDKHLENYANQLEQEAK